jgi:lysozyme family protein
MIMPNTTFDRFVSETIKWETGGKKDGAYHCDPDDLGGETKWGISKASFPDIKIKALTFAKAKELYKKIFWTPAFDLMCEQYAFKCFDIGVVTGPKRVRRMLQRAIKKKGQVTIACDGIIGPITLAAIISTGEDSDLIYRDFIKRLKRHFWLISLRWKNKKYYKGWIRRVDYELPVQKPKSKTRVSSKAKRAT